MSKEFADISSYQPNVNFTEYRKAGHRLIAIKAGGSPGDEWQGDPAFEDHWRKAGEVGLIRVCYFFCRFVPGSNPAAQADHFIEEYTKYPERWGDRLCPDFETQLENIGATIDAQRRFVSRLQSRGMTVVPYASPGYLSGLGNPQYGHGCKYWLADYAQGLWNPGHYPIWAWQHTDGDQGKGPFAAEGIGKCDMSTLLDASDYAAIVARQTTHH